MQFNFVYVSSEHSGETVQMPNFEENIGAISKTIFENKKKTFLFLGNGVYLTVQFISDDHENHVLLRWRSSEMSFLLNNQGAE